MFVNAPSVRSATRNPSPALAPLSRCRSEGASRAVDHEVHIRWCGQYICVPNGGRGADLLSPGPFGPTHSSATTARQLNSESRTRRKISPSHRAGIPIGIASPGGALRPAGEAGGREPAWLWCRSGRGRRPPRRARSPGRSSRRRLRSHALVLLVDVQADGDGDEQEGHPATMEATIPAVRRAARAITAPGPRQGRR